MDYIPHPSQLSDRIDLVALLQNLKSSRIGQWVANLVGTSSIPEHATLIGRADSSTPANKRPSRPDQNLVGWYLQSCEQGRRPSIAEAIALHVSATPSELTALLCAELAQCWKLGDQVPAEQFFEKYPAVLIARDDAVDLIYAEYLERERAGQTATADQYASRFPLFADELRAQIEFHQALDEPVEQTNLPVALYPAEPNDQGADLSATLTNLPIDRQHTNPNGGAGTPTESRSLQIQGYDILEEIGRGGMGVVFKARHRQLDRLVALKMLLEGPFSNPNHARRFLVEAKASARLQHPGIVQIHEVGEHEGRPFLAFEYIDGGTLAEHIRGRPIQPLAAAAIVESLARAVQFAHERSIVHRDLKPSNVMLQHIDSPSITSAPAETSKSNPWPANSSRSRDNLDAQLLQRFQFKITDFGLAKFVEDHADQAGSATIAGDIMGTAAYMSPEQARGDSPKSSPASDIYSLGAILYELLTGRPPFVGTRPIEVLAQVVSDDPVRPSQLVSRMPADLQTICLKCLEKTPNRRYGSAMELAQELARFQENIPIVARHTSKFERSWRWCRRHPAIAISIASIALLLMSVSVVTTVYSFLLKEQLGQTKAAELAESKSRKQAIERLWGSYLAEADARRNSRQIGQRMEGLAAIESARKLADTIGADEQQIARMRETAIACLALPDVRMLGEFSQSITLTDFLNFDANRTLYAYLTDQNQVVVKQSSDNRTIAAFNDLSGRSIPILSPNGQWLMILNDHCRVYRLNQTPPEQVFETKSRGWWSFAPDSTKILGADGDGDLKLIDFATGTVNRSYGPLVAFERPLVSPDHSQVALVTREAIEVLDLKTGTTSGRFDRPTITANSPPYAWHPNSKVLAVGPYEIEGVILWDIASGAKLDTVDMWGGAFTPYFNSTGNLLLGYAKWGGRLSVWNTETHEMEFVKTNCAWVDIRPDAIGGFSLLTIDKDTLSVCVVEPSPVLRILPKPLGWNMARASPDIVYSQDGRYLAHGLNGQVLLYETSSFCVLDRVLTGSVYGFVGFDGLGSLLTLTDIGLVRWPVSAGDSAGSHGSARENQTTSFGPPEKIVDAAPMVMFAVSPDGRQFAVSTAEGVLIYRDDAPDNPQFLLPHRDVRSISFNADGSLLASGGWSSGTARIWNVKSGQLMKTLDESTGCTVKFSPDSRFLVTNSNRVCIWNVETWELMSTVPVQGSSHSDVNVCFSPDSRLLAVSETGARIHLLNPETGKTITTLTNPHHAGTSQMVFSPAVDQLAVASGDSVFIWDLVSLQESLVQFELGLPELENRLATLVPQPVEKRNPADGDQAIMADHEISDSNNALAAAVSARFVLDEHFQQLAVTEHIQRAQIAVERGELSAARILVGQALSKKPDSPNNCNNLAWLLATGPPAIRDAKQAEILARRAIALAPDEAIYLNTLGVALYRTGKYSEAIATLEKSLTHNEPLNQPYDLLFLAMCHAQAGDAEKARECQKRASQLMKEHANGQSKLWHEELREFANETRATLAIVETQSSDTANDYD